MPNARIDELLPAVGILATPTERTPRRAYAGVRGQPSPLHRAATLQLAVPILAQPITDM